MAFDHAYHGRTNLTMALTAKNMPYKDKMGPFAGEIYRMPMAYPFRWPGGPEACAADALDVITGLIHTQVGEDNVAAVLIEPIQGEGGFVVPPDGFLTGLATFCRENGILLIADEIQSGFCRTGDWFAVDHEGVVPDLVTTAKGIAARAAAGRGDRAYRDHGFGACRRARRHLRREPGGLRGRTRRDRDDGGRGPGRAGPPDRRHSPCCPGCTSWPRPTRSSGMSAAAAR